MSLFGVKKSGVTYGALIDIGSGSVGVGIVESDARVKLPKVIYAKRDYFKATDTKITKQERFERLRSALFSITLTLGNEGLRTLAEHNKKARISRILVTCASPWAHTVSRTIDYKHEEGEVKVTQAFLNELIEDVQEQIEQELQESEVVKNLSYSVVERATVAVKLNGYGIHDPIDKKAARVSLAQIVGLVPQDILEVTNEIQEKILTNANLSTHTYLLVMYCVLRDLFPKMKNFGIVDVTGESTEIGIVEDSVLVKSVHVPYGSNTLLRDVAKQSGKSPDDVISHMRLLDEQVAQRDDGEVSALLEPYENELSKGFQSLYKDTVVPGTLVVTALPTLQHIFADRIPEVAHTVTGESHTALEIESPVLDKIAEMENMDVFITVASRFFHKLHGCGEIEPS